MTYLERFTQAITLLCKGRQPPTDMIAGWLDGTDDKLQEFTIDNEPPWAQGCVLLDAAKLLADTPAEEHHPNGEPIHGARQALEPNRRTGRA